MEILREIRKECAELVEKFVSGAVDVMVACCEVCVEFCEW